MQFAKRLNPFVFDLRTLSCMHMRSSIAIRLTSSRFLQAPSPLENTFPIEQTSCMFIAMPRLSLRDGMRIGSPIPKGQSMLFGAIPNNL